MAFNKTMVQVSAQTVKHHRFLNLGLSAVFALGAVESFNQVSAPLLSSFCSVIFLMATIGNSVFSIPDEGMKGGANSIVELIGLRSLNYQLKKTVKKLLPYQHKALSTDELYANNTTEAFIQEMFYMSMPNERFNIWRNDTHRTQDVHSSNYGSFEKYTSILQPLYEKHFKDSYILANSFLKGVNRSNFYNYAKQNFQVLWQFHGEEFTEKDMTYIEKNLKHIDFDANCLATDENIFSKLSFSLQEKILVLAQLANNDTATYNKILKIHQQQKEYFAPDEKIKSTQSNSKDEMLEEQKIVINPQSQKKLDTLEERFNSIFDTEKDTLKGIQDLLLAKEKLSLILEDSGEQQYIEAKLFLDNDVDRVVKSFNDEIKILHKMKLNSHPQLDAFKEITLNSINERMSIIQEKMLEINERLNDDMAQDLNTHIEVNRAVLKAKA